MLECCGQRKVSLLEEFLLGEEEEEKKQRGRHSFWPHLLSAVGGEEIPLLSSIRGKEISERTSADNSKCENSHKSKIRCSQILI